jgi:DNA repair protein RadA/Sms
MLARRPSAGRERPHMARPLTQFACTSCGHATPRWMGRCPGCGEWNTLVEEPGPEASADGARGSSRPAKARQPVALTEVEAPDLERLPTGSKELDGVLGGGIVPGSMILIGGSPGIGKSTLMSSMLASLERRGRRTLYVSGEESAAQIRLRAERLGPEALAVPVLAETSLETVLATLKAERPEICVIDSVQTLQAESLTGAPGTVGQVREVAARLERFARDRNCAVILVGHVTKDGSLAGPRVLEHAVDCVLQFEGERERTYRILRALKNRFGSTNEVGIFEMRAGGLREVGDPSARFARDASATAGACVLCAMEGSRPLLVEVQALVAPTDVVPPRRVANGVERNRLSLVLAVLARHVSRELGGGQALGSCDVFVSVAGGVRVEEPGADLAVALAVASGARGIAPAGGEGPVACFGEVGLTGELRYVGHTDRRLEEAARFGLERVLVPTQCLEDEAVVSTSRRNVAGAATLADALAQALASEARPQRRAA